MSPQDTIFEYSVGRSLEWEEREGERKALNNQYYNTELEIMLILFYLLS